MTGLRRLQPAVRVAPRKRRGVAATTPGKAAKGVAPLRLAGYRPRPVTAFASHRMEDAHGT